MKTSAAAFGSFETSVFASAELPAAISTSTSGNSVWKSATIPLKVSTCSVSIQTLTLPSTFTSSVALLPEALSSGAALLAPPPPLAHAANNTVDALKTSPLVKYFYQFFFINNASV